MKLQKMNPEDILLNKRNPRIIRDDKFKKLLQSIKEFPEMLEVRPIVVDENMMVLGGNMRLKAVKELKMKEVPVIILNNLTEKQKGEFLIKDNSNFGDWDWDVLQYEWDVAELTNWGLDFNIFGEIEETQDSDEEDDRGPKDIKDVLNIQESVNFIIKCKNLTEVEVLQKRLNLSGAQTKINYDLFIKKLDNLE